MKLKNPKECNSTDDLWKNDRLYVCESSLIGSGKGDKIVFWNMGLISMGLSKGITMKRKKK